jgi:hypothetical protein
MEAKKVFSPEVITSFKKKFGYDVDEISEYVDMTSDELIPLLIDASTFLDKVFIDTEVKNKKLIKLVDATLGLTLVEDCDPNSTGGISFAEVTLETAKLGDEMLFCNQDLVGTWAQLLLRSGAKAELEELPAREQVMMMWTLLLAKNVEDLIILGDTSNVSPLLNPIDGLIKLWGADPNIIQVPAVSITNSTAYDEFLKVQRAIPSVVFDNNVNVEIICSRVDFNKLVDNLMNDNNYHYTATITGQGNNQSLVLPGTGTTVRVQRQLTTGQIYAVPYDYVVVGTDATADLSAIEVDYMVEARRLRVTSLLYLGVNYARSEYFVKYGVNPS